MNERFKLENGSTNQGQLIGKIVRGPIVTHSAFKENFYEVMVEVKRLSENTDIIPVTFGERMITDFDLIKEGNTIAVSGEFRSHNKIVDNKSRLLLYFFAKGFISEEEQKNIIPEEFNILKLLGFICKPPVLRETPFGRQICDLLLAVNRTSFNRTDYIPCLAWGRNAYFAGRMPIGTSVEIEGRIQSRPYKKQTQNGEEEHIAYEVSCKNFSIIENPGQQASSKPIVSQEAE